MRHAAYSLSLSDRGTNIDDKTWKRIDIKQWIFSSEIASGYRNAPRLAATVRAPGQPLESLSRGVNPFCSDAASSRTAKLILTLTTRSSHRPARRYKRQSACLARCAYSLTIPLVALLVLRFTCLTPSVRPYYVPRCSLLLVLVLPPPPKSMLLADREFSLRLATARVTSFLLCPSLSFSRPFCSSHVASREFLSYVGRKRKRIIHRHENFGVPAGTVSRREKTWDNVNKMRADIVSVTIFHRQMYCRCAISERSWDGRMCSDAKNNSGRGYTSTPAELLIRWVKSWSLSKFQVLRNAYLKHTD